jgi:hypothetical protein
MSEERGRRQAGTYDPGHRLNALRSLWCSCWFDVGNVEDFRAPEGTIALTLDVEGALFTTALLNAADIVDLVDRVDQFVVGQDYHSLARSLARQVLRAAHQLVCQDAKLEVLCAVGPVAVWSALNHPQQGTGMRRALSDMLARKGSAYLTWHQEHVRGLAMGLSDVYMDLHNLIAVIPPTAPRASGPTWH